MKTLLTVFLKLTATLVVAGSVTLTFSSLLRAEWLRSFVENFIFFSFKAALVCLCVVLISWIVFLWLKVW
jgi:hypothetical protein